MPNPKQLGQLYKKACAATDEAAAARCFEKLRDYLQESIRINDKQADVLARTNLTLWASHSCDKETQERVKQLYGEVKPIAAAASN